MTPKHIISKLLESDAHQQENKYSNNLELLKKIILSSYVGRLRINGVSPDHQIDLGTYLFDNERLMFDFSRLSSEKKQDFLDWLLKPHELEKQVSSLNNVYVNEWRGYTAEEQLGWWEIFKHWINNKQFEHWKVADFKLSTDYQMTGIEAFHGEYGLLIGFNQHLVPSTGNKYKDPNDLQSEPLGNTKKVILTNKIVEQLTQNRFKFLNSAELCKRAHPQSVYVTDLESRFEDMRAYRSNQQFVAIKPWYVRLWHWFRSLFYNSSKTSNVVVKSEAGNKELIALYKDDKVHICKCPDSSKIIVIEKKPDIDNLTLCGGGPKIFTHIGVLKALEEVNHKPTHFSGASAGAIMALMAYLGYSADEIKELFKDMKQEHLVHYDMDLNGLSDSNSLKTALDFAVAKKLKEFVEKYNMPYPEGEITFKVLETIRQHYPDCGLGKQLIVTSTNKKTMKTRYFSLEHSPDREVTKAVEASALMPIVYKEIMIDGEPHNDGGILCNFPTDVFSDDLSTLLESEYGNSLKLLAIQFNNGTEEKPMWGILDEVYRENPLLNWIYSMLTGVDDPATGWVRDRIKLRKHALQTIVPNIDDIPVSGFSVLPESQDLMIQRGKKATIKYLKARYGRKDKGQYINAELMYSSFNTIGELLSYCCYRGSKEWFDRVNDLLVNMDLPNKAILMKQSHELKKLYFGSEIHCEEPITSKAEFNEKEPNPLTFFGNSIIENPSDSYPGMQNANILVALYPVFIKLSTNLVPHKQDKFQLKAARHALNLYSPFSCLNYFNTISHKSHIILHVLINLIKELQKNPDKNEVYLALQVIEKMSFNNFKNLKANCYDYWDLSYAQSLRFLNLIADHEYDNASYLMDSLRMKTEPMQSVVNGDEFLDDFSNGELAEDLEIQLEGDVFGLKAVLTN